MSAPTSHASPAIRAKVGLFAPRKRRAASSKSPRTETRQSTSILPDASPRFPSRLNSSVYVHVFIPSAFFVFRYHHAIPFEKTKKAEGMKTCTYTEEFSREGNRGAAKLCAVRPQVREGDLGTGRRRTGGERFRRRSARSRCRQRVPPRPRPLGSVEREIEGQQNFVRSGRRFEKEIQTWSGKKTRFPSAFFVFRYHHAIPFET
jgi:hypothetical protein